MGTDPATRARIAAFSAAEAAIELNTRDPFAELEKTSAAAALEIRADPEAVKRIADEIVVKTFRAKLNKPGSLEFLCISCGSPLPCNRLVCSKCEPEFLTADEP